MLLTENIAIILKPEIGKIDDFSGGSGVQWRFKKMADFLSSSIYNVLRDLGDGKMVQMALKANLPKMANFLENSNEYS